MVAQNTLSNWENDKYEPDKDSIKKIAKYFNTTADYILGLSDDPAPPEKGEPTRSPPDLSWGNFGISFYGTPTEDDKEMVMDSINFAMEQRRKRNAAKRGEQNKD